MTKKLMVLLVVAAVFFSGKAISAEEKAPAKSAKQPKVVETRINEADMDRLVIALNRAVKEAVIAKQGPAGWEYTAKRMKPPKNEKWQGKWNDLGQEGWEVIDHFENIYIFKRPALIGSVSTVPVKAAPVAEEPKATSKEDEKAAKEAEKAAKKAEKEKEKAAKKAEKEAKKAAKKAKKNK